MKTTLLFITALLITGLNFSQSGITMGGTSTWTQINVPTTSDLLDIDFANDNPQVGYIGAANNDLLKTTNGGLTWEIVNKTIIDTALQQQFPVYGAINDIEFSDVNNGFMLMDTWTGGFVPPSPGLFQTTDGGNTWSRLAHNGNVMTMGSIYSSNSNLFLGGAGFFESSLIMEFDNTTWTQNVGVPTSTSPNSAFVSQMDFRDSLGLASTNGRYILRSIDYGQTWDTVHSNLDDVNAIITSITIYDELTAYAGYVNNVGSWGLLKSEDGGVSWFKDVNSTTFFYPLWTSVETKGLQTWIDPLFGSPSQDLQYPVYAGAEILASSNFGMIFESNDGINWNYTEVAEKINAIASEDSWSTNNFIGTPTGLVRNTFAIGNNGYLLTNLPLSSINTQENVKINIYPNPAADKIAIEIEDAENWNLIMMDANMKEINIKEVNSNHKKEVNISDLPKGVYYVTLTKENQKITKSVIKY